MTVPANNTSGGQINLGLPYQGVPLVDKNTGLISRVWWPFFQNLYDRVGGTSAPSNSDLYEKIINNVAVVPPPEYDNYNDSCPGIPGPQGIQGIQGIQGAPGMSSDYSDIDSYSGIPGPQGIQGAQGIQGVPGAPSDYSDIDCLTEVLSYNPINYNPVFATVTASGTITPSSTAGIVGTTTNDSANAGSIGEYVTATASGVAMTSTVTVNVTSISLTAGDWDVSGLVGISGAATTTLSNSVGGTSTTSATLGAVGTYWQVNLGTTAAGATLAHATPRVRISIAATTTVYLVAFSGFATSTCSAFGVISARRIR